MKTAKDYANPGYFLVTRDHITDMIAGCTEDVYFVDAPSAKIKWIGCYRHGSGNMPVDLVGCIGVLPRGRVAGWVRGWYVRPEERGKGYGMGLLYAVEVYASKHLWMDRLYCNTVHTEMMEKAGGWKKTGRGAYRKKTKKQSYEWVKHFGG